MIWRNPHPALVIHLRFEASGEFPFKNVLEKCSD